MPSGYPTDITGRRFGRLTVVGKSARQSGKRYLWECRCDCGNTSYHPANNLTRGASKSCGCLGREVARDPKVKHRTHGMWGTPEWAAWHSIKTRCINPRSQAWANYGGRGITICAEWRDDFAAFFAHVGARPDGHEIDRIDNDRGYEPGNVRWVPRAVNMRNRRNTFLVTAFGETMDTGQWSRRTGVPAAVIWTRIKRGWAPDRAVSEPAGTTPSGPKRDHQIPPG